MAESFQPTWTVKTHIIPASHPRGYRRGVRDPQTSRLRLHVKQYIPQQGDPPPSNAITIVVQHGLPPGDHKEGFEPFMWDLLSQPNLPPIRAFWAMDMATGGESFLLNKDEIGDQPHWFDIGRDMLQMINHFQNEMKPPLLAYCHSYGANAAVSCAAFSPRIFQGIVLCEPAFEHGALQANDPARLRGEIPPFVTGVMIFWMLATRRSRWPSHDAAKQFYLKNKMFATWDKRTVALLLEHDLVDLPDGSVELKTPNVQITQYIGRPSPPLEGYPEDEDYSTRKVEESDWPPGFYNPNRARAVQYLESINCPVLYQWSTDIRFLCDKPYQERCLKCTGIGLGGGGGKALGQVTEVTIDASHNLPLQKPTEAAKSFAEWIRDVFWPKWTREEEEREQAQPIDPVTFPPELMKKLEATRAKMLAKM